MKYYLLMIVFVLLSCSSKGTDSRTGLYGHWMERGSSTFTSQFQCVEAFKPFRNKDCE